MVSLQSLLVGINSTFLSTSKSIRAYCNGVCEVASICGLRDFDYQNEELLNLNRVEHETLWLLLRIVRCRVHRVNAVGSEA